MKRLSAFFLFLTLSASAQTPEQWYRRETGSRLSSSNRHTLPDSLFSGAFFRCRPLPAAHPSLMAGASRLACLSDELSAIHTRIVQAQGETGNQIRLAKLLLDVRRQAVEQYVLLRNAAKRLPVVRKRLNTYVFDGSCALTRYDGVITELLGTAPPPIVP
ncbi:MAG: hypothetical protein J7576_04660 [Siphonobacter aquaeclarae]|nr:hypothetical protein [Siphonobacter aquaeclarae]